ncbi:AAA family ATPase [Neorhizobium sp. T6_25]|uniref:AAA family ATPase n=1 Tax=Neorhizobium sp. T6_25 TaxID=2093833 RepID=UPI000CF8D19C|nr:AAA family ATPase [Neorhizobium sp. T6_25]
MIITKLHLQNWRNFKSADATLRDVTYVLGINASGKSNFLDVFRFLRDVAKSTGGGLQKAVSDRGTLKKLRCLRARTNPEIGLEIEISNSADDAFPIWKYKLSFNTEGKGAHRLLIVEEVVTKYDGEGNEEVLIKRPDKQDRADSERLTQTALEQIQANAQFRELAEFFGATNYLHVVPQLLKFGDLIGGRKLEDDPFGQGFMERIARTSEATRKRRLARIEKVLKEVIPQVEQLDFVRDEISGTPHLEVRYIHHRPRGAIQREDQFSDGTLRLISLFWLLLDGTSLLLLEEPELSLNEEIVAQLPRLIEKVQKSTKKKRQIIVTTHSKSLLGNAGIDGRSLLILQPSNEGTAISQATDAELEAMDSGFSPAEVVLPRAQKVSGASLQMDIFA